MEEDTCAPLPHLHNPPLHHIPNSNWVCDEEEDCADEAEERMCPPPFICDGDYEIPAVWVCDDEPDCEDGTDEQNCE